MSTVQFFYIAEDSCCALARFHSHNCETTNKKSKKKTPQSSILLHCFAKKKDKMQFVCIIPSLIHLNCEYTVSAVVPNDLDISYFWSFRNKDCISGIHKKTSLRLLLERLPDVSLQLHRGHPSMHSFSAQNHSNSGIHTSKSTFTHVHQCI